jgi:hypothetical protein
LTVACELVGVAGFEPAASSSRTMATPQVTHHGLALACAFIPQHPPASPKAIRPLDAPLTHARAPVASFPDVGNKISTA